MKASEPDKQETYRQKRRGLIKNLLDFALLRVSLTPW
jgi:hypothetical protein